MLANEIKPTSINGPVIQRRLTKKKSSKYAFLAITEYDFSDIN